MMIVSGCQKVAKIKDVPLEDLALEQLAELVLATYAIFGSNPASQ